MNAVLTHFDTVAKQYNLRSHSGMWGRIRAYERTKLESLMPLFLGEVLELGCGAGFYSNWLLKKNITHLTCIDFSSAMLKHIPRGATRLKADLDHLEIDQKFDLIFCAGAFEFVKQPEVLFGKLKEMLTPEGSIVLLVPGIPWLSLLYKWAHLNRGIKINLFSPRQLKLLAQNFELEIANCYPIFPFNYGIRFKRSV